MRILITGICGFVGSWLARFLADSSGPHELFGIDNLFRRGTATNRPALDALGCKLIAGDIRLTSDVEALEPVDWIVDAAAYPSVLGGVDGRSSARQIVEHNLLGTLNLLEHCRRTGAGLILLSTSRVYSIRALNELRLTPKASRFELDEDPSLPPGVSREGVTEEFSTAAPISLYGATKLASETLALEYGYTHSLPVWINRCGVLAGAGQFGTAEQGIFSFWLHSWRARRRLQYTGFGGKGWQVRDAFHPLDLAALVEKQLADRAVSQQNRIWNVGGGPDGAMSLAELSEWCRKRFGDHSVQSNPQDRLFDIPWMIMDTRPVRKRWSWQPQHSLSAILEEIASHADANPDWLSVCGA
jgi:CDP-paratose 2-epimerase